MTHLILNSFITITYFSLSLSRASLSSSATRVHVDQTKHVKHWIVQTNLSKWNRTLSLIFIEFDGKEHHDYLNHQMTCARSSTKMIVHLNDKQRSLIFTSSIHWLMKKTYRELFSSSSSVQPIINIPFFLSFSLSFVFTCELFEHRWTDHFHQFMLLFSRQVSTVRVFYPKKLDFRC